VECVRRAFSDAVGPLVDAMRRAVEGVTGIRPVLSTSGGTSDGRFLATLAREVVEFGPLNESIHKIDERVALADIGPLSAIYESAAARSSACSTSPDGARRQRRRRRSKHESGRANARRAWNRGSREGDPAAGRCRVGVRRLEVLPDYLLHGGTIRFARAYAMSCPRCSCRSPPTISAVSIALRL